MQSEEREKVKHGWSPGSWDVVVPLMEVDPRREGEVGERGKDVRFRHAELEVRGSSGRDVHEASRERGLSLEGRFGEPSTEGWWLKQ